MPLPVVATPTYDLTLPVSEKKIKFRPFLVKEEKILLIASESKNQSEILNSLRTVVMSYHSLMLSICFYNYEQDQSVKS